MKLRNRKTTRSFLLFLVITSLVLLSASLSVFAEDNFVANSSGTMTVNLDQNSVLEAGQSFRVTVSLSDCAPLRALAIETSYSGDIELVSAKWLSSVKGSATMAVNWDADNPDDPPVAMFDEATELAGEIFELVFMLNEDITCETPATIVCGAVVSFDGRENTKLSAQPLEIAAAHDYSDEYFSDAENHWLECSFCHATKDVSAHEYSDCCDTTCDDCSFERVAPHSYDIAWVSDGDYHWHECTECDAVKDVAEHVWGGAHSLSCSICEYAKYVIGDTNDDGIISTDDAIYLLRHTLLPASYPVIQNCDFNRDGTVSTDDAIYLLRHTLLPGNYPLVNEVVEVIYLDADGNEVSADAENVAYCEKNFYEDGKLTKAQRYTYPENTLVWVKEYENENLVKITEYNSDGSVYRWISYKYDENGIRYERKYLYASDGRYVINELKDGYIILKSIHYTKDDALKVYFVYEHYDNGVEKKVVEYNPLDVVVSIEEYSIDGKLAKKYEYNSDGTPKFVYGYDANGNVIENIVYTNGEISNWYTTEFDENSYIIKRTFYTSDGSVEGYFVNENNENGIALKRAWYYPDGSTKKIDEFNSDKVCVRSTVYNTNGTYYVNEYEDGVRVKYTYYNANGSYSVNEYTDGLRTKYSYYGIDGALQSWTTYEYNSDGKVSKYVAYNAYVTGNFVGYNVYAYSEDGTLKSETYYNPDDSIRYVKDYKYDGAFSYTYYNKDGEIVDVHNFKNGASVSVSYWYNSNSAKVTGWFLREYNTSGTIVKASNYNTLGNKNYVEFYNNNGVRVKRTEYAADGTFTSKYFDTDGNITKTVKYDKDGNILSVDGDSVNTIEEYKSLYVSDGNVMHLNFAEATTESKALVGSSYYKDATKAAVSRFGGVASNYTPYLFNSTVENPVSGGTAPILTPWYFEDWYADWTVKLGTGKISDMRTVEPLEYAKTATKSGTTVYVVNTVVNETAYYIQNGEWAKKTYASEWGDGYIHLGLNSTLSFANAVNAAKDANDGSYTVQFVAQRVGNGLLNGFVGIRFSLYPYQNGIRFTSNGNAYQSVLQTATIDGVDLNEVNGYTFTFDRTNTSAVALNAYVNSVLMTSQTYEEKGKDNTLKIFENADSNIYSIRVYDRVLTEKEVLQNHFADLALISRLDITEFLTLNDGQKAVVYEAMRDYTLDLKDMKSLLQKALDDAVVASKAATVAYNSEISVALNEVTDNDGNKFYAPKSEVFESTNAKFNSSNDIVWNNTGVSTATTQNTANISVAWDGSYVYAFIEVDDSTLTTIGKEACESTSGANLFYNDSFEFYYCFGTTPNKNSRKIVKMDAYGYVKFAGSGEGSVFFDEIEAVGNCAEKLGKYYIVFKIPAKAEDGTQLKAGDTVYFSEQINDVRDISNPTKVFCSGANRDYSKWVAFTLGSAE